MDKTFTYLGIRINYLTRAGMVNKIEKSIAQQKKMTVSYFNFHTSNIVNSSPTLNNIFKEFDIIGPDGIAVLWTSWLFGQPLTKTNSLVVEFLAPLLFEIAIRQGWGIYLLGSQQEVVDMAADRMRNSFPGINVVGTHHGHFSSKEENLALVEDINNSKATIVLVGMGQPKQEEWILTNKDRVRCLVLFACGGYFDKAGKRVEAYPLWVYKLNLCWIYRLMNEPKRLWKRYTIGAFCFGLRIVRTKFKQILANREIIYKKGQE